MADKPISQLPEKTTGISPSDEMVLEDAVSTKKVKVGVLFSAAASIPVVNSVSPQLIQNTGNQTVTVSGSGFTASDIITVSGAVVVSSTVIDGGTIEIVIDTDATSGGTYTVTVTNQTNGLQGNGNIDVLTYTTEDVEFTSFSLTEAVTIGGKDNNLRRPSSSGNGWTGDARSTKGILQGDGRIEFDLTSGQGYRMVGFSSNPDAAANWQNLDFAIYNPGTGMRIYSRGGYITPLPSFSGKQRFSIELDSSGNVLFRNVTTNTLLYTMTSPGITYPMYFDTSIYSGSDFFIIENCTITGILG